MVIWVTGAIGSGKSAVAARLRDLGVTVRDLDEVVHALHERADIRRRISEVLKVPLTYSRADLAGKVFNDPAQLRTLEKILHPEVWSQIAQWRASVSGQLVIEMPLPPHVEPGDRVICVEAPIEARVARLLARGMSEQDALARIAAAPSPDAYRVNADVVLNNAGGLSELHARVLEAWAEVTRDQG